jgi:hypothetical protein
LFLVILCSTILYIFVGSPNLLLFVCHSLFVLVVVPGCCLFQPQTFVFTCRVGLSGPEGCRIRFASQNVSGVLHSLYGPTPYRTGQRTVVPRQVKRSLAAPGSSRSVLFSTWERFSDLVVCCTLCHCAYQVELPILRSVRESAVSLSVPLEQNFCHSGAIGFSRRGSACLTSLFCAGRPRPLGSRFCVQ